MTSPPSSLDTLRPSVQEVADLVRTRIVLEGGEPADTFTADTYPTAAQVERLIDQASNYIFAQLPNSVSESWAPAGKHLAALYSAMLVEASYFREQLTDDQVQLYRDMLIAGIRGLGASSSGSGSSTGETGVGSRMAVDSVVMSSLSSMSPTELWLRDLPAIYRASVIDSEGADVSKGPISLVPQTIDLAFYAGDGVSLTISASDASGAPLDLAQGQLKAQIRQDRFDSDPRVAFTVSLTPTPGMAVLSLTGVQTAALVQATEGWRAGTEFSGAWDLEWTAIGQQPITIVQGKVTCRLDVTRG